MHIYEKNLQALARHHPELVTQLERRVDTSHIVVEEARTGVPRLLVTNEQGEQIAIHNEDDPWESARDAADKLQVGEEQFFLLLGFGLGYLALEIAKKLDKGHVLLICESDPGIFQTAMHLTDLEPLLHSERIKILVGEDVPIGMWIESFHVHYFVSKVSLVKYHPSYRTNPEYYQRLEQQITDTAMSLKINLATMLAFGPLTLTNLLRNLPWIRRFPGVKQLTNRFAGRPAIVAAAGPSLEKHLHLLKDVKDKAVLIAVDTLLGILPPHGILPDIVVTLDPEEWNCHKFREMALDKRVPMVCHPCSQREIITSYPGKKFATAVWFPIYHYLARYWEDKGLIGLRAQAVGHVAFDLARLIGADPIVFVGLDLSFPQPKFHAGNMLEEVITWEEERPRMISTTDIFGQRVNTIPGFKSMQGLLEQEIQNTKALCIDATEGGVRIAGTQVMRLRDVIDEYCQIEPLDIAGTIDAIPAPSDDQDLPGLLAELNHMHDQARTMDKTSHKILRYIEQLQRMQHAGHTAHARYARLSTAIEQATRSMQAHARLLDLLPQHVFELELYMSKREITEIDDMEEGEERFTRQLERAQVYYHGIRPTLQLLMREISAVVKHLETEQRLHAQMPPADMSSCLRLALEWKELGDYDTAIPLFERCLVEAPQHAEALYHLTSIHLMQGQYSAAQVLLQRHGQDQGQGRGLQKLRAVCQEKMARWEAKVRQVRQHSMQAATGDALVALLEPGNFYFRVQNFARAAREYLKVVQTHPALPEAHYHLAHTYFEIGDVTAGLSALETVVHLCPDNTVVYRDLGFVAWQHGQYVDAERFFLKAIELDPNQASLHAMLGDIYVQQELWLQAAHAYEAVLRLEPQRSDVLQSLALLYQKHLTTVLQS